MDDLRVFIVGLPGSGKTTLARQIADLHSAPVHTLDQFAWNENEIKPYSEREEIAQRLAADSSWIAEGVYVGWTQALMERADVVVKMEISLRTALWRIFWRHVKAEIRRDNRFHGWRRLFRFMRSVRSEYRGEYGSFTDEDVEVSPAAIDRELRQFESKLLVNPTAPDVIAKRRATD